MHRRAQGQQFHRRGQQHLVVDDLVTHFQGGGQLAHQANGNGQPCKYAAKARHVFAEIALLHGLHQVVEPFRDGAHGNAKPDQCCRSAPQGGCIQHLALQAVHGLPKGFHFRLQALGRHGQRRNEGDGGQHHTIKAVRLNAAHHQHCTGKDQHRCRHSRQGLGRFVRLPGLKRLGQCLEAARHGIQCRGQGRLEHLLQAHHGFCHLIDGYGQQSNVQQAQETVDVRPADGVKAFLQCGEEIAHRRKGIACFRCDPVHAGGKAHRKRPDVLVQPSRHLPDHGPKLFQRRQLSAKGVRGQFAHAAQARDKAANGHAQRSEHRHTAACQPLHQR